MCLYNAICLSLNGSEDQAYLLRLHVGIHYLLNAEAILQKVEGRSWEHTIRSGLDNLACVFAEHQYSDMLMVEVASQVIKRPIRTDMVVCPKSEVAGPHLFKDTFGEEFSDEEMIDIMWTAWVPHSDPEFRINHFVPMVPRVSAEDFPYEDILESSPQGSVNETEENSSSDDDEDLLSESDEESEGAREQGCPDRRDTQLV